MRLPEGRKDGILPYQTIKELIDSGRIVGSPAIPDENIQPASLDLRLGDIAHRVRASFLPGPNGTVEDKIKELRMARVDLTGAAVFERDCVYIVPLIEEVYLPEPHFRKSESQEYDRPIGYFHPSDYRPWSRIRPRAAGLQGQAVCGDCFPHFHGGDSSGNAAEPTSLCARQSGLA